MEAKDIVKALTSVGINAEDLEFQNEFVIKLFPESFHVNAQDGAVAIEFGTNNGTWEGMYIVLSEKDDEWFPNEAANFGQLDTGIAAESEDLDALIMAIFDLLKALM